MRSHFKKKENWETDIVVLLQPPFRTGKLIDKAIRMLIKNKKVDAVMAIRKPDYPPYWMMNLKNGNRLKSLIKNGNKFLSRQQLTVYQPAGSVYALRKNFYFQ